MKKKLIVIAGPTASGKTAVSVELAKHINGEIISADSMQIYRFMDIGSAKVTKAEMQGVPHFLIDELEPSEAFNINRFQQMAHTAMDQIYNRNHIPIIAGGTGFYIQAVTRGIDFSITDKENTTREEVENFSIENGRDALYQWLVSIDETSAKLIHPNNVKRVKRAIEYYLLTGEPISLHNDIQSEKETPYDLTYIVLTMERDILYHRIDKRVDLMVEKGLVQEVQTLKNKGYTKELTSMQGLGYKEILSYLDNELSLDEAIYLIKRDTRHFAKRQLTWFRREKNVQWVHVDHFNFDSHKIMHEIVKMLN